MSKRGVDVWIVRVKLEFDDTVVKDRFVSNIQDINHFRCFNKAQCNKFNVWSRITFLLLNDRIFLIIIHLAKIVSSPFRLLVQNKHLIIIVVSLIAIASVHNANR